MKNKFEEEVYEALCEQYGKNNVLYEPSQFSYTTEHFYTPDFRVKDRYNGGRYHYIEAKGYLRPDHRRILAAVKDQCDIDLRLVFQKNQKLYKGSQSRYSDWAESRGFQHCIGTRNIKDIFE